MLAVAWSEKVSVKEAIDFFKEWRTREDFKDKFELTPMQSWRVIKYLETKRIMIDKTKKCYRYKMRQEDIKKNK